MNISCTINLNPFSNFSTSFLYEELLPSLTQTQKKIGVIALAAFMCLAVCYAFYHCLCKNKISDIEDDDKKNAPHGGALIEGDMKNGKLHGKGKKSYPDGRVWEGTFEHGVLEGQGKRIFADGSVATGIFLDGELVQGKLSDKEGNISYGTFKDYLLDGRGKRTDINKQIEYGEFISGEFVKGTKTLLNGGLAEGEFKDGKLHGQGKLTFMRTQPKWVTYKGLFFSGNLVQGKKSDFLGILYKGDFATCTGPNSYTWKNNGHLEKGKITYLDGTTEEGEFALANGNPNELLLNGKGKRIKADGSIEEGIFKDGILSKS